MSGLQRVATMRRLLFIGLDAALTFFVEKFVEEGVMKALALLVRNGCYLKLLPSPPTDTPTNWATLMTGCWTGTHGLTSFQVHLPGEPLTKRHSALDSRMCRVPFLWDVLEREGYRCVVVNYPVAWPPTLRRGIVVGGPAPLASPWRIGFSKCFSTKVFKGRYSPPTLKVEFKPSSNPLLTENSRIEPLESRIKLFEQLERDERFYRVLESPTYTLGLVGEERYERAVIIKGSQVIAELREGEWSPWIYDEVITDKGRVRAAVRVKLAKLTGDASDVRLYCTDIHDTHGWCYPESLAESIVREVGPYAEGFEHPGMHEDLGYLSWLEDGYTTLIEQAEMQASWIVRLAAYLDEREGWDALILHYHLPDALNHWLLGLLHPEHPEYTLERARIAMKVYREAYRVIDGMIGRLLSLVDLKNTVVVVVSDHGSLPHWKFVNLLPKLLERGLIAYRWSPDEGCYTVDWSRTRAFPYFEPTYIWVNLKSRYPHGIVDEEEYEEVREQIIQALYSIRDPETGECPVALASRREDLVHLGQWGDRVGDVVYFLKPGYSCWNTPRFDAVPPEVMCLPDVSPVSSKPTNVTGYHSAYLPTARIGEFEIPAPAVLAGSGIRRGYARREFAYAVDLAPTILHLLGVEVPSYMEGRILRDILVG